MDEVVPLEAAVCITVTRQGTRRVRALRVAAGLTQAQVAERSGVTQESISRLERGIQRPQKCTLQRVADALGVPPEHVLAVDPADVTVCVEVGSLPRSSATFRERLVAAIDAGFPRDEAVQHFGVSTRTIARWIARHRAGHSLAPQPLVGRQPRLSSAQMLTVREVMLAHPDATLVELAERVTVATGVRYSPSHLCRIRRRLDLPQNKSPSS